jgi:hypothetical protein
MGAWGAGRARAREDVYEIVRQAVERRRPNRRFTTIAVACFVSTGSGATKMGNFGCFAISTAVKAKAD